VQIELTMTHCITYCSVLAKKWNLKSQVLLCCTYALAFFERYAIKRSKFSFGAQEFHAIMQYMQLSNMQLKVHFSYRMIENGFGFWGFHANKQYMRISNMRLSDHVCTSNWASMIFRVTCLGTSTNLGLICDTIGWLSEWLSQ